MNLVVTPMNESDSVKPARWPRSRNGPARAVYLRMLLGLFTLAMTSQVAPALTIQFRFGDRFEEGSPQRQALEWAADRWETQLHDPIIVTIDAAFDDLTSIGADVLGVASSVSLEVPYTDVRAALIGDVTSADDQLAVDHLPLGPSLAFRTCDPQGSVITSNGSDTINRILTLSRADAKALQLPVVDDPAQVDGTIRFTHRLLDSLRTDFNVRMWRDLRHDVIRVCSGMAGWRTHCLPLCQEWQTPDAHTAIPCLLPDPTPIPHHH